MLDYTKYTENKEQAWLKLKAAKQKMLEIMKAPKTSDNIEALKNACDKWCAASNDYLRLAQKFKNVRRQLQ